jgi:hypothetical protein
LTIVAFPPHSVAATPKTALDMDEKRKESPTLKRLWAYWWKHVITARGGFDTIVFLIAVIALIVSGVSFLFGMDPNWATTQQVTQYISFPIAILLVPYCLLWLPFKAHEKLENALAPALKLRTGTIADGCNCHHTTTSPPLVLLRLRVTNEGVQEVEACKAVIARIERDGRALVPDLNKTLTFAPGEDEDAEAKTIHNGLPAYIDVIQVQEGGTIGLIGTKDRAWPEYFPSLNDLFCNGDTVLTIAVSGRGTRSVTGRFRLHVDTEFLKSSLTEV